MASAPRAAPFDERTEQARTNNMADDNEPEDTGPESPLNNLIFPRKLLKNFILLYKEQPCLWDRTCPAYKQKNKRHEAINRLTALVQEIDPTATRVHVLRKIESLRACVRREHKRVRESRRKARSPDEIYKPNLWYYDLFSFVFTDDGYTTYCPNYVKDKDFKSELLQEPEEEHQEEEMIVCGDTNDYEQSIDPADYTVDTNVMEMQNKRYPGFDDDPKAKRLCTEVEDEYDAIGINVAAKLRNLPANMRILAEKLINDVLFQAQLNGLNQHTVISTPERDPIS